LLLKITKLNEITDTIRFQRRLTPRR